MKRTVFLIFTATCLAAMSLSATTLTLEQLDLSTMTAGWSKPQKNLSVTKQPLSIGDVKYENGVGTHADSDFLLQLDGNVKTFSAKVGVDDDTASEQAAVEFFVYGDGHELWRSGVCKWKQPAKEFKVNLTGIKSLELMASAAGEGVGFDHADWVDTAFKFNGTAPQPKIPEVVVEEPFILTPSAPATPRINSPKTYGVHPGSPFLYRIPCTGQRPITFKADKLPEGLVLDPQTGIITGKIATAGTTHITLHAQNSLGEASADFCIVAGKTLALTPPMGWNDWYIHYHHVSEDLMKQAADQMIASGMADYGYQYVNIDDCWMKKRGDEPYRDADGAVLPNAKFPDMKGLTDYIHSKGLKAGIYTSPGPWTCGGYTGAWQHEATDARKFAEWGFDFLKYDWCSYSGVAGGSTLADLQKPYQLMCNELQKLDRDMVFNLCQYGKGEVWKWGGDVGNCWRTTGDLGPTRGARLPGWYTIGLSNAKHAEYARPGAWNDPDYILIGWIGKGSGMVKTTLTPNEQYSYMSMWSLMASPLIFSGDMAQLDPFTLNVLCNPEVIAVDQDSLGQQARILRQNHLEYVLARDLDNGSKAIGLFNLNEHSEKITISWSELGLSGKQRVHDVWRQQDLGKFKDQFQVEVPRHGVAMLTISPNIKPNKH